MKKINLLFFGLIVLFFSSCYQEFPDSSDSKNYVKISASINQISTRATGTSWSDGDAIGIYMKKSGEALSDTSISINSKYITNGSLDFTPASVGDALLFPFNKSNVDFIAYYPYKSSITGLNYPIDVSNQSDIAAIDFMYATASGLNSDSPNVNLSFKHQLSMINLDITTTDIPDLSVLKARLVGAPTKATFSLVDGVISNPVEKKTINLKINNLGTTVEGLIIPTTDLTGISLELIVDTVMYRFNLDEATNVTAFNKSTKYSYNVKLYSKVGVILGASIEDWATGETEDVEINGEFVSPDTIIEPEDPPVPPLTKGTQSDPYTVDEALVITDSIISNVWLTGYYVGDYKDKGCTELTFDGKDAIKGKLGISSMQNEIDSLKIFPASITDYSIIDSISISVNKNQEILINGNICNGRLYPNSTIKKTNISSIRKVIINGFTYPKAK